MNKAPLKLALAAGVFIGGLAMVTTMLAGAGGGLAFFRTGADPDSALNLTAGARPADDVPVEWLPDPEGLARPVESAARDAITAAYLSAWAVRTGIVEPGLPVHLFTGPARAVAEAGEPAAGVVERVRGHRLQLRFYSADGQIASLEDTVVIDRQVDEPAAGWQTIEHYQVVVVLVDGNWRVRHWIRTPIDPA